MPLLHLFLRKDEEMTEAANCGGPYLSSEDREESCSDKNERPRD